MQLLFPARHELCLWTCCLCVVKPTTQKHENDVSHTRKYNPHMGPLTLNYPGRCEAGGFAQSVYLVGKVARFLDIECRRAGECVLVGMYFVKRNGNSCGYMSDVAERVRMCWWACTLWKEMVILVATHPHTGGAAPRQTWPDHAENDRLRWISGFISLDLFSSVMCMRDLTFQYAWHDSFIWTHSTFCRSLDAHQRWKAKPPLLPLRWRR